MNKLFFRFDCTRGCRGELPNVEDYSQHIFLEIGISGWNTIQLVLVSTKHDCITCLKQVSWQISVFILSPRNFRVFLRNCFWKLYLTIYSFRIGEIICISDLRSTKRNLLHNYDDVSLFHPHFSCTSFFIWTISHIHHTARWLCLK